MFSLLSLSVSPAGWEGREEEEEEGHISEGKRRLICKPNVKNSK